MSQETVPVETVAEEMDDTPLTYADGTPVQPLPEDVRQSLSGDDTPAGEEEGEAASAPTEPASTDEAVTPDPGILSPEEFESVKGDPQKLIKALNQGYTRKMQSLSRQTQFGQALESDPVGTIKELVRLAKSQGLDIGDVVAPATPATPQEDPVFKGLSEALGEDAATLVLPAIQDLIKKQVMSQLGPVRDHISTSQAEAARQQGEAALQKLATKYPDYTKYESEMSQLMQSVKPGDNMGPFEYMEVLYKLASHGKQPASMVEKVVKRMGASASAAGKPNGGVSASSVRSTKGPSHPPTIREAFEAALRGEIFEDD